MPAGHRLVLPSSPVPVVVIGGFLGAGKTSVLNHLLRQCGTLRAAVLVNDFGALNVDAELVVGVETDLISLANGCICCSIRGDLLDGCLEVLRRPQPPDLLIVETSGVSDTVAAANTFLAPELRPLLSVQTILAVVDAAQFADLDGEMAALAHAQLVGADMVVLNKVDLVTAEALAELRAFIHRTVPGSRLLEVSHGRVPLEPVLGALGSSAHELACPSTDDGGRRHPAFATWHWQSDRPLSLDGLRGVFSHLPEGVYRAKGIVDLDDLPGHKVLLQMAGRRSSLAIEGAWAGEPPASRIVLIGRQGAFDAAQMQATFDACIAAAAAASPLKAFAATVCRQGRRDPEPRLPACEAGR